jgi:hypothetical protein
MKWILAGGLLLASTTANAEVVSSGPNGFHVRETVQVVVPTAVAYDAFGRVAGWWSAKHSYSGDSKNLSLSLSPGGCFCERIPESRGGIEHMRVAYVDPGKRIVMTGSLGPLLYEATSGVMDVQVERIAGGSKVTLDYRVAGFAEGGAQKLAPVVDGVLADQMRRYRAFARGQPKAR